MEVRFIVRQKFSVKEENIIPFLKKKKWIFYATKENPYNTKETFLIYRKGGFDIVASTAYNEYTVSDIIDKLAMYYKLTIEEMIDIINTLKVKK